MAADVQLSVTKKVLYALLTVALFVGGAEGILHLLAIKPAFANRFFVFNRNYDYPEVFERDARLLWKLRGPQTISSRFFDKGEYRINSLGMRGPELDTSSDAIRILALGNSCTFGWQVSEEDTYLFALVDSLNKTHTQIHFQPIDAGIPGYSSYQGRVYFDTQLRALKPQIALIMFGWNDQWAASNNIIDSEQKAPPPALLDVSKLVNRLRLYHVLRAALLKIIEPDIMETVGQEDSRPRVPLSQFRENLLHIVRAARAIGCVPVALTSPIPALETYYPPHRRSPMHDAHYRYNRIVNELAFEYDIALVDLASEFDKRTDLFTDVHMDPIHFNAKGHHFAAELLYPMIEEIVRDSLQLID